SPDPERDGLEREHPAENVARRTQRSWYHDRRITTSSPSIRRTSRCYSLVGDDQDCSSPVLPHAWARLSTSRRAFAGDRTKCAVCCNASYSSRETNTASPRRELISTGARSSLTCSMSGTRFLRASDAVIAIVTSELHKSRTTRPTGRHWRVNSLERAMSRHFLHGTPPDPEDHCGHSTGQEHSRQRNQGSCSDAEQRNRRAERVPERQQADCDGRPDAAEGDTEIQRTVDRTALPVRRDLVHGSGRAAVAQPVPDARDHGS